MSYTIYYRAMFIRTKNEKFIPIIEEGDNNVYDVDTNKRSRDWESCRWQFENEDKKNEYALTEQEIMANAQSVVDEAVERYADKNPTYSDITPTKEDVLNNLGSYTCIKINGHSSWGSAKDFLAFFKSGFRNAVTFDDLREHHCFIRLSWWKDGHYCSDSACSEDELAEKYAQYRSEGITPYITLFRYNAEDVWEAMKERKPKVERKKSEGKFVIAFTYCGGDRYLTEWASHRIKFHPFAYGAHKYASRKIAETTAQKLTERYTQLSNVRVELATA